jgi:hypothetical protein
VTSLALAGQQEQSFRRFCNRADEQIWKDRRITAWKLAPELSVSKGSVNNIVDAWGYAIACARWVPRSLTDDHKTVRKEVSSYLPSRYEADGESFFATDRHWGWNMDPSSIFGHPWVVSKLNVISPSPPNIQ